jgi:hypothetical protein
MTSGRPFPLGASLGRLGNTSTYGRLRTFWFTACVTTHNSIYHVLTKRSQRDCSSRCINVGSTS